MIENLEKNINIKNIGKLFEYNGFKELNIINSNQFLNQYYKYKNYQNDEFFVVIKEEIKQKNDVPSVMITSYIPNNLTCELCIYFKTNHDYNTQIMNLKKQKPEIVIDLNNLYGDNLLKVLERLFLQNFKYFPKENPYWEIYKQNDNIIGLFQEQKPLFKIYVPQKQLDENNSFDVMEYIKENLPNDCSSIQPLQNNINISNFTVLKMDGSILTAKLIK